MEEARPTKREGVARTKSNIYLVKWGIQEDQLCSCGQVQTDNHTLQCRRTSCKTADRRDLMGTTRRRNCRMLKL